MTTDDAAARKARAQKLHKQIEGLAHEPETSADDVVDSTPPSDAPTPESPREFIHRRMRDLSQKPKRGK